MSLCIYDKVKIIVAVLTSQDDLIAPVVQKLEKIFGRSDFMGKKHPFVHTSYYEDEMGGNLFRIFLSFETLFDPASAHRLKMSTQDVEKEFSVDGKRRVNVDAGYIDANKVVLVTGKHGGHKIAIHDGIWADMLLWYNKGWQPLPWAFPDFKSGIYFDEFTEIRKIYKQRRIKDEGPN